MTKKFTNSQPIHVLSIGTRILVKDVMDQYLRSLGEVKTYYASKLSSAIESFQEKRPSVVFCEQSFPEGSAVEFIEAIGGLDTAGERYFILATEEKASDEVVALAMEKGIDEILVKPFATDNILQIMERFLEKRGMGELDWAVELRAARRAYVEKRFQESDELYGAVAKKHWHNGGVLLDCAEYFLRRQQPQKSVPLLEKVLQESPDQVRALHLHGCSLRRLGRFSEAARQLARANQQSPLNTVRNTELAECYLAMAEDQISTALKSESESSSLILRRAQLQLLRREYGMVVSYLDSKRAFLSDAGKKEAEAYVALAKKLGGLK
jgi:DNA-binding NarL/FixJ family response regulator